MVVSVYQLDLLGLREDGEHQSLPNVQNVDGLLAMNPSSSPPAHLARDAPALLLRPLREQYGGDDADSIDTRFLYGHRCCR